MWMVILVRYLIMIIVMRTFIWDEKHRIIMVMGCDIHIDQTSLRCMNISPNIGRPHANNNT